MFKKIIPMVLVIFIALGSIGYSVSDDLLSELIYYTDNIDEEFTLEYNDNFNEDINTIFNNPHSYLNDFSSLNFNGLKYSVSGSNVKLFMNYYLTKDQREKSLDEIYRLDSENDLDTFDEIFSYVSSMRYDKDFVYSNDLFDMGQTSYSLLFLNKGVCSAFAMTLDDFLDYNGFESRIVAGTLVSIDGSMEPHAWVRVKLSDEWVHVDPLNNIREVDTLYKTTNLDSIDEYGHKNIFIESYYPVDLEPRTKPISDVIIDDFSDYPTIEIKDFSFSDDTGDLTVTFESDGYLLNDTLNLSLDNLRGDVIARNDNDNITILDFYLDIDQYGTLKEPLEQLPYYAENIYRELSTMEDFYTNSYIKQLKNDNIYNGDLLTKFNVSKERLLKDYPDLTLLDKNSVLKGDQVIKFDTPPVIQDGRTLVPVRSVVENFGVDVGWDNDTRTVELTQGDLNVKLPVDSNLVLVNNTQKELDVNTQIFNSRTYVPLRFLSETLGYNIYWLDTTRSIMIEG